MNITKAAGLLSILAIGIAILYFTLGNSEKDKIRLRLNELETLVSTTEATTGLLGKARIIKEFRTLFANPVAIKTNYNPANGIHSPTELAAGYLQLLSTGNQLTITFSSPAIALTTNTKAQIRTKVNVSMKKNGTIEREASQLILIKVTKDKKGSWKFDEFIEIR